VSNPTHKGTKEMCQIVQDVGMCITRHRKGPSESVGLYRMSECSGFALVNKNTLGPSIVCRKVTGCRKTQDVGTHRCRKTQVSNCTSFTALICNLGPYNLGPYMCVRCIDFSYVWILKCSDDSVVFVLFYYFIRKNSTTYFNKDI
jgi:hypothetical protein